MNEEKKSNFFRDVIVVGFALFSMFFGAGNVIFPPYLGMESGQQWLAGFSAYYIADIGLALLGMFALLRVGSSEAVLHRVGRVPAEILMCAIILCIGPMVAIPRTSASTFEMAIAPNLPGVSPVLFSILFFAVILALCIKESAVVDIVGKILTPLLLVGLFASFSRVSSAPWAISLPLPRSPMSPSPASSPAIRPWTLWRPCPLASSCCRASPIRAIPAASPSCAW